MKRQYLIVIFVHCLWFPPHVEAFIDPPVFTPQPILENQAFSVSMRRGECDAFPALGFPIDVVQVPPNRVQVFVTGLHQTNALLCLSPIGTTSISLPALPAGEYQFELYVRNRANPFIPIHNGPVAPFTVVGANPVTAIPTLTISGILATIVGMFGLAWFARNRLG